MIYSQDTKSTG